MNEESFLKKIEVFSMLLKLYYKNPEYLMFDFSNSMVKMPQHLIDKIFNFSDYTEIKQSLTHGIGVFAIQNISKGSVITIYPCDALIDNKSKLCLAYDKEKCNKYCDDYKLNCDNYAIVGFPENKTFSGHLINDACSCVNEISNELLKGVNFKTYNKLSIKYMLKSIDRINCKTKYNKTTAYIVASRDITAGEEIFMSYQLPYWIPSGFKKELHKKYIDEYFNEITENQKQYITGLYKQYLNVIM